MSREVADTNRLDAGECHCVVVFDRAAGDANCAHQDACFIHYGETAREGDEPLVRMLDSMPVSGMRLPMCRMGGTGFETIYKRRSIRRRTARPPGGRNRCTPPCNRVAGRQLSPRAGAQFIFLGLRQRLRLSGFQ